MVDHVKKINPKIFIFSPWSDKTSQTNLSCQRVLVSDRGGALYHAVCGSCWQWAESLPCRVPAERGQAGASLHDPGGWRRAQEVRLSTWVTPRHNFLRPFKLRVSRWPACVVHSPAWASCFVQRPEDVMEQRTAGQSADCVTMRALPVLLQVGLVLQHLHSTQLVRKQRAHVGMVCVCVCVYVASYVPWRHPHQTGSTTVSEQI